MPKQHTVKTLACVGALVIMAVGAVGLVAPSGFVWIAQHSLTSGAFYVIAAARVAFGLILISTASVSRAPKALRALGYLILIGGILTAVMGLAAIEHARAIIDWWVHEGAGAVRLTGLGILTLGAFVAFACAPSRRDA